MQRFNQLMLDTMLWDVLLGFIVLVDPHFWGFVLPIEYLAPARGSPQNTISGVIAGAAFHP